MTERFHLYRNITLTLTLSSHFTTFSTKATNKVKWNKVSFQKHQTSVLTHIVPTASSLKFHSVACVIVKGVLNSFLWKSLWNEFFTSIWTWWTLQRPCRVTWLVSWNLVHGSRLIVLQVYRETKANFCKCIQHIDHNATITGAKDDTQDVEQNDTALLFISMCIEKKMVLRVNPGSNS